MEKHNHGIDQDIALYFGATIFSHLPNASDWKKLALNRFWKQLDNLFASDGSYLEHSPSYSYLLCDRFLKFKQFLKEQSDPYYLRIEKLIADQLNFLTYILQPDGQIPPIGDGNVTPLKLKSLENAPGQTLKTLQYVVSGGSEGLPPDQLDKLFPVGGYAMIRNKWNYDLNTVQLIFYASFHSRVHKHHDDLSITLFGHGQPLLVDAGKFNYNYESPERQYVISTRAHNTVIVDDLDTEVTRNNIGKSGLTGYFTAEDLSFVSGVHLLYPGVIHLRMLFFIKPWNCVVLDWLQGSKEHRYEQIFNFEPTIQCSIVEQTILGKLSNGLTILLSPLTCEEIIQVKLARGEKNPLLGWYSSEYSKLTPSGSGSYLGKGTQMRFATHINLLPSEQVLTYFKWKENVIQIGWQNKLVEVSTMNLRDLRQINFQPLNYQSN